MAHRVHLVKAVFNCFTKSIAITNSDQNAGLKLSFNYLPFIFIFIYFIYIYAVFSDSKT